MRTQYRWHDIYAITDLRYNFFDKLKYRAIMILWNKGCFHRQVIDAWHRLLVLYLKDVGTSFTEESHVCLHSTFAQLLIAREMAPEECRNIGRIKCAGNELVDNLLLVRRHAVT